MIQAIQCLLRLQEIDLQLSSAKNEVASFGPRRKLAAEHRAAERDAVRASEQALAEMVLRQREAERALSDVDSLVEKLASQLYEVTSKHALDALQGEQSRAAATKSEREDLMLEILESVEAEETRLEAARLAEREGLGGGAQEEAEIVVREKQLADEIARLDAVRAGLAADVETAVLRTYDRVRRKRLPAVVHAHGKMCPVCRMTLGPQKLIELRAANILVHCGTCDCILYGETVAEAERAQAETNGAGTTGDPA